MGEMVEACHLATQTIQAEPVRVIIRAGNKVDRLDAGKALGRSPKTLADWARNGLGPRPQNIMGRIFYDWDEIQDFMRGKAA